MYDKESFLKEQPLLSHLFVKAREHNHLSHAYLLYGDTASPLLDSALFLAKSLFCERDLLACSSCDRCLRFDEGTHPDFLLIDGSRQRIKKEDIQDLEHFASMSSLENGHISCYVINHVENISEEAINALLKTIEEPSGNTIAFLTTSNKERVLPTIISRCEQVMVLSPDIKEKAMKYDGDKVLYYLMSNLVYDEKDKEELMEDDDVRLAYSVLLDYCTALKESAGQGTYVLMLALQRKLKGSSCYNYLYGMLLSVMTSALLEPESPLLGQLTEGMKQYKEQLPKAIALMEEAISKRAANLNGTLVLARFCSIMEDRK